ncbi:helix-hairpin-helix domain-containing protein [Candidatus Woesebacteria bacterium]|nr:helix-hairpin-helix domain-containing protein [Candidatus Woesebacteria bacterium]
MWDQWQHSVEQGTGQTVSVDQSQGAEAAADQHWYDFHHLMEWWRWALICTGIVSLVAGATILVQSGQSGAIGQAKPGENAALLLDTTQANQEGQTSLSSSISSSVTNVTAPDELYIDVSGAVVSPGMYAVEKTARAGAAVAAAGGLTKQANQTYILKYFNAAAPISDGQKIYIPFANEDLLDSSQQAAAQANADQDSRATTAQAVGQGVNKVSINKASSSQLDSLPGIGAARSEQIIAGRPYTSLEDLVQRKVLSESIFSQLEGLIEL